MFSYISFGRTLDLWAFLSLGCYMTLSPEKPNTKLSVVSKYPQIGASGSIESYRILMSDGSYTQEQVEVPRTKLRDVGKVHNLRREQQETKEAVVAVNDAKQTTREENREGPKKGNVALDLVENPGGAAGDLAGNFVARAAIPGGAIPIIGDAIGAVGAKVGAVVGTAVGEALKTPKVVSAELNLDKQEAEEERARREALEDFGPDM